MRSRALSIHGREREECEAVCAAESQCELELVPATPEGETPPNDAAPSTDTPPPAGQEAPK